VYKRQPLRGGNGVTQPDELAKFLITWVGIWMVVQEGIVEGQQYTDMQFSTVFGAVVAVAGLQMYFQNCKENKENEKG
jgi:uncharacterized membrane protein (DUF373 family)